MPFFLNQKNITKRKKQKSKKTLLFEQVWALPDPPSHLSNNIKQIKLNFLSNLLQNHVLLVKGVGFLVLV